MLVTYIKDTAGIPAGKVKNLPDKLALAMIEKGFCVEGEVKENTEAETRETKEDKKAAKRNTK